MKNHQIKRHGARQFGDVSTLDHAVSPKDQQGFGGEGFALILKDVFTKYTEGIPAKNNMRRICSQRF